MTGFLFPLWLLVSPFSSSLLFKNICQGATLPSVDSYSTHQMRSRTLPIAVHPANHPLVQELCLVAALLREQRYTQRQPTRSIKQCPFLMAAQQLAHSPVSLEEARALPKSHPAHATCRMPVCAWDVLSARLSQQEEARWQMLVNSPEQKHQDMEADTEDASTGQSLNAINLLLNTLPVTGFIPPARLLTLYGPATTALLKPLAYHLRDTITYASAMHHERVLRRILQPLGFRVALTGAFRRGCPESPTAEFILTLTDSALQSVRDVCEEVNQASQWTSISGFHESPHAQLADLRRVRPLQHSELRHLVTKAWDSLRRCGYLASGCAADKESSDRVEFVARMWSDAVWQRLIADGEDEETVASPPPQQITDPVELLSLQLHTVVFHVVPCVHFFLQQFFLTGPPSFVGHVTTQALLHGVSIYDHGVYVDSEVSVSGAQASSSPAASMVEGTDSCSLTGQSSAEIRAEEDIFEFAAMPAVHPFNRALYVSTVAMGDGSTRIRSSNGDV